MKHFFWVISNIFGYLFGRALFAQVYHGMITLCLHGLGYDNMYRDSWSGERWFIKNKVAPLQPKVCIDIGANVGAYTKMLLQYTNAQVYAVEPSSSSLKKLQKLGERTIVVPLAVSDFDGEAVLYSSTEEDERATLDKNVREGKTEEKVRVCTLNTLSKEYDIGNVDFIKIDTEGFEKEVLSGLGAIKPNFIQFEFNKHHLYRKVTLLELTQLLPEYEFYRLLPHGWIKIHPRKYVDNVFMFCNIVAKKVR